MLYLPSFLKACQEYNGRYNIYAGRNPRPKSFPVKNHLDIRLKQRAKDRDIEYITAISLDIDPIREKGTSSTERQHDEAIMFAHKLQHHIGGCVDDSGNGAYLWVPFADPIKVEDKNRNRIKLKCKEWQRQIIADYRPERFGMRIDGCFDLSRIKKVLGTLSVKGKVHRLSRIVLKSKPANEVREAILAQKISERERTVGHFSQSTKLPVNFMRLLQTNPILRDLWCSPDENNDTSRHDWRLGCTCMEVGITNPIELAAILMQNPFGKFRRDGRYDYVETTVNKMVMECGAKE